MTRELESASRESARPQPADAGAHGPHPVREHLSALDTDEVVIGIVVVALAAIVAMLIMLR
jgi:hypothetical protein